jgi:putative phosphoesterase
MRLGVVSDTHKHIVNLDKAVKFLKEMHVDRIIHLGDDYDDPDEIGERDMIRVPGVFSDAYQDEGIQNRRIENIGGWRFLLTHTLSSHPNDLPEDLSPGGLISAGRVHVVLYGHTHIPEVKREEEVIFLNPGHLKNEDKKGFPPTFGYVELTINELLIRIFNLHDYSVRQEERYRKR